MTRFDCRSASIDVMTEIQLELLRLVARVGRPEDVVPDRLAETWNSAGLVGTARDNIDRFIRNGLLEYTGAAALEKKFTRVELRALLGARGIESNGRKTELANLAVETSSPKELEAMLVGLKRYAATAAGRDAIARYEDRKRARRARMEEAVRSSLRSGDVLAAARHIGAFDAEEAFKLPMAPNYSGGRLCPLGMRAEYLISHPYDDLPFSNDTRRAIGVELALAMLLGERIDIPAVLRVTGGEFACRALEQFLTHNPYGMLARDTSDDDDEAGSSRQLASAELAYAYTHTRWTEACAAVDLHQLLDNRELSDGVEILPVREDCRICSHGKKRYSWADIAGLPKIPRHWGCRCTYISWSKSSDDFWKKQDRRDERDQS